MIAHTPGPWHVVDNRIIPTAYVLMGAPVATVHTRKRDGMQKANARLIAAAPKLHDTLAFLLACCYSLETDSDTQEAMRQAISALSESTGGNYGHV